MRVVLIGPSGDRARLRANLTSDMQVVGEAPTLAAARANGFDADAWLVTPDPESDARDPTPEALTARELQVLELVAHGLPNKGIAMQLGISDQTVKFHVASIYGKLGAANRTDAVRRGVRLGLISL